MGNLHSLLMPQDHIRHPDMHRTPAPGPLRQTHDENYKSEAKDSSAIYHSVQTSGLHSHVQYHARSVAPQDTHRCRR